MVSPFLGAGFADAAAARQTRDTADRRVDLLDQQLQQKAAAERLKGHESQYGNLLKQIGLMDQLAQAEPNKYGASEAYKRDRAVATRLATQIGGLFKQPDAIGLDLNISRTVDPAALEARKAGQIEAAKEEARIPDIERKAGALGVDLSKLSETEKKNVIGATRPPPAPSLSAISIPIIEKIRKGEAITKGERDALDEIQRLDAFDKLTRALTAGSVSKTADVPKDTTVTHKGAKFTFSETRDGRDFFKSADGRVISRPAKR